MEENNRLFPNREDRKKLIRRKAGLEEIKVPRFMPLLEKCQNFFGMSFFCDFVLRSVKINYCGNNEQKAQV